MRPLLGIQESLREIWHHKFRSLLTMSGIILGVASLMSMFAITTGIAKGYRRFLVDFGGARKVYIVDADAPEDQQTIKDLSPGRTYRDVLALRHASLIEHVSPEQRFSAGITYGNKSFYSRWFRGVEESILNVEGYELAKGRFITQIDQERYNHVMVIGSRVQKELWGKQKINPIGKDVLLNGHRFKIVGLLKNYNNRFKDSSVFIPLTTTMHLFYATNIVDGIDLGPRTQIERIVVQVKDFDYLDDTIRQIQNILLRTHRGVEDFTFVTLESWVEQIENSIRGVRISGFLIAGVSLIAGGVGITNIMLASIRERIRELGVRRAIGAGYFDIFIQIAMEAIILSLLGGTLGIAAGMGLLQIIGSLSSFEYEPIVEPFGIIISYSCSVIVGLFAAIFPAFKASNMKPIEALRFE